ncbi:anthranilate synthase component I family protein [Naasia sp. SYSU D00948]|uniref:anthranilate synthase component I family protein n=1 Tax=Naasia sp. SYSU D00948 TaxID=2817379 RepID=UPI001B3013F5|nr:anthranilate synthase component I family protein [Naasia sp. SYSU D00948]
MRTSEGLLAGWADPADVFERLAGGEGDAVLLEATDGTGESMLGLGGRVIPALPDVPLAPDEAGSGPEPGWIGWITYEGEARFLELERGLVFDPTRRRVRAFGGGPAWRREAAAAVAGAAQRVPAHGPSRTSAPVWRHGDARYLEMVRACQEAIVRGDAYVLCLTNTATVEGGVDGWAAYRRLRSASPTHHAGYLRIGGTELVSASPERFAEVTATGVVRSRPIKGTRPRSTDPDRDDALAEELRRSDKERAENLMIVDLVRNDLSRVAEVGSVRVPRLFEVESYRSVHQLVSVVEARIAPGRTAADAIRSLFPAGSMTGAPKESAIAILAALEAGPRGLYSGAFGRISRDGSADLAMTIRSIVVEGGRATVGSGGGVTALSDPVQELEEVRLKAAPLLSALAEDGYP